MSQLVRPSEAAALAIHACALLAGAEAPLPASRMAAALGASEAHLAKVLQRLSREGLVSGTRGPRGGFTLLVDPASLTLRDVYEAIEGPLVVRGCLLGVPLESGVSCPLEALLERVSEELREGLAHVKLAALCAPRGARRRTPRGRTTTRNGRRSRNPVTTRR